MNLLIGIVGILILIIIYTIVLFLFLRAEEKSWNNGKCPHCGEPWDYETINMEGRIYKCKNNHRCIRHIWNDDHIDWS